METFINNNNGLTTYLLDLVSEILVELPTIKEAALLLETVTFTNNNNGLMTYLSDQASEILAVFLTYKTAA